MALEDDNRDKPVWSQYDIGQRRILITRCVGQAWEEFCQNWRSVIVDCFKRLGLSLPIDGSQDAKYLSIKGLDGIKVGNWRDNVVEGFSLNENCETEIPPEDDEHTAVEFV